MDVRARLNLPDIGLVRRYLKIATVLIALIGGLSAYASTKDTHRASSVVAVVPPSQTAKGAPVNPINQIDQKTAQLAVLASSLAQDPAVRGAVSDAGATLQSADAIESEATGSSTGARLRVVVTAPTRQKALDGLAVAETRLEQAFGDFQAQAGVSALAKQAHLVPMVQESPTVTNPGRIRNALTTFLTILVGGVIILLLIGPPNPVAGAGPGNVPAPLHPSTQPHVAGDQHARYVARTRPTRGGLGTRGPVSDFPAIPRTGGSVFSGSPDAGPGPSGSAQMEEAFDQAAAQAREASHRTAAFDAASGSPIPGDADDDTAEWQVPAPADTPTDGSSPTSDADT